jgi:hypothetical protein
MPYGRHLEMEADYVGIKLAAKACFDVRYSPVFWMRMDKAANEKIKIPELLSTHPTNENRARELERLVPDVKYKITFFFNYYILFFFFISGFKTKRAVQVLQITGTNTCIIWFTNSLFFWFKVL